MRGLFLSKCHKVQSFPNPTHQWKTPLSQVGISKSKVMLHCSAHWVSSHRLDFLLWKVQAYLHRSILIFPKTKAEASGCHTVVHHAISFKFPQKTMSRISHMVVSRSWKTEDHTHHIPFHHQRYDVRYPPWHCFSTPGVDFRWKFSHKTSAVLNGIQTQPGAPPCSKHHWHSRKCQHPDVLGLALS